MESLARLFTISPILLIFLISGCSSGSVVQPAPTPGLPYEQTEQLADSSSIIHTVSDSSWADSVLKTLSLRQKVAQMIFPKVLAHYFAADSRHYLRIQKLIQVDEIGGLVVFQGDVMEEATMLNEFQSMSKLPLWVMQDTENGLAMRIRNATLFPHIMTLGAIDDTVLTYRYAKAIAKENRAVGIHHALAPVVDINNNPTNPVINVRSFGADRHLVARHGLAYVRGTQDGGQVATIKHFPGHGDTGTDSHISLPVVNHSFSRLDSVELYPYRYILEREQPTVMIAHLALPYFGNDPATLNARLLQNLLFDKLKYQGFLVSDAMDMGAIEKNYGPVQAAVQSVQAGMDAIILPIGEEQVIDGIVEAVRSGEIREERINSSARKILLFKSSRNLHQQRYTNLSSIRKVVASADHLSLAEEVASRSLTLLRNDKNLIPFNRATPSRLLTIYLSEAEDPQADRLFVSELRRNSGRLVESVLLDKLSNSLDYQVADERLKAFNQVILVTNMNILSGKNRVSLSAPVRQWLERNEAEFRKKKTILVALGNPYVINSFPFADAVVATYSISDNSQRAAVAGLVGETAFSGKLPVELGSFPIGSGIIKPLPEAGSENFELACEREHPNFIKVKTEIEEAILEGVAPGMAVGVVSGNRIWYQKAFGRLTYDQSAPAVSCSTMFDLASLTKVFAATMTAMVLYDRGDIRLDDSIRSWYPAADTTEKSAITIRHLLTHTSGFEAWRPFFKYGEVKPEAIIDTIIQSKLVYQPGDSSVYSDWNFILLADIMKKITGKNLNELSRELLYAPLGLTDIGFLPKGYPQEQMAPTEKDDYWRNRLVQGTVHDETADMLGGISGHAGLFSTIRELSVLTQVLLNNGRIGSVRLFTPETVKLFTSPQGLPGGRGLGWDIKSPKGYTSAGSIMGPRTYGHLGFTGNSVWIDPEGGYGIILLSNRVYPTRNNKKISAFRPKIYDKIAAATRYLVK